MLRSPVPCITGMPHLPDPSSHANDEVLGAMGDGFGSFRPSTSFNDLSSLLNTSVADDLKESPAAAPSVEEKKPPSKKRAATTEAASAPKRKPSASRRVSVTKKDTKPKGKASEKANAPNPLTGAAAAAAAAPKPAAKLTPAPVLSAVAPAPAAVATAAAAAKNSTKAEETELKTIAQAAVSGLIQSTPKVATTATIAPAAEPAAKTTTSTTIATTTIAAPAATATKAATTTDKVDTSTEHIKALTGNNWVAACAGAAIGVTTVPAVNANDKNGNRARRQNLTADERARQNRDRNREHARNTRLRKKAYVEELKRTLTELVAQRDAAELEKRQSAQRELEQREVRFRVIEEFLKLRGRNETNFARWAAILEDGFSMTLPLTDLNKMVRGEVAPGTEQTINGVSDVMADANVFSSFLETLGSGDGAVTCQFQCERKNFFMDGCEAVLEWTATSVGAVAKVCFSWSLFLCLIFSIEHNRLTVLVPVYFSGSTL